MQSQDQGKLPVHSWDVSRKIRRHGRVILRYFNANPRPVKTLRRVRAAGCSGSQFLSLHYFACPFVDGILLRVRVVFRGTSRLRSSLRSMPPRLTRLSCHRFRSNEVRLWLSVMAYNLGNLWRRLVLPRRIENWSLTSLQQRLVKTGGRLVKARAVLLASAGGERPHVAAVRGDGAPDCRPTGGEGIGSRFVRKTDREGRRDGRVRMEVIEKMRLADFEVSGADRISCFALQTRDGEEKPWPCGSRRWRMGVYSTLPGYSKWKFRLESIVETRNPKRRRQS